MSAATAAEGGAAAAALLDRARLWVARDRAELALETLQRLQQVAPDHREGQALRAELLIRAGRLDDAKAVLARLRLIDPGNEANARLEALIRLEGPDKARLRDVRLLAKGGRTEAALAAWRALFPAGAPSDDLALEYLQLLAGTPNSWAAVHAGLRRLSRTRPENPRYRFALAEHELRREPLDLAALRRVIEMANEPAFARAAQSAWRRAVLREEPTPQAQALLRQYLAQHGTDTAVRERLGAVTEAIEAQRRLEADPAWRAGRQGIEALERGDLAAAEPLLLDALGGRPDDADVVGAVGMLRLRQGRHAQAQVQFQRAAALEPEGGQRWRDLARTARLWGRLAASDEALERGDAASALKLAQAALGVDEREPEVRVALARAHQRLGELPAAEAQARAALRLDPVHAGAFRALLSVLGQRGDSAALTRFVDRLTPAQRTAFAGPIADIRRDRLRGEAERAIAAGQTDDAVRLLRDAIRLDPEDPWLRLRLARLHGTQGETERGRALFASAGARAGAQWYHAWALYESQLGNDLDALHLLERIVPAERTEAMARTQRRLWFAAQLERAGRERRDGAPERAAAVLREVEGAAAGDLELTLDVAEGWLALGESWHAHVRALLAALPAPAEATRAAGRLRQARLLLRAGALEALPPLLDELEGDAGWTDTQRAELAQLRDRVALQRSQQQRERGDLAAAIATLRERIGASPPSVPMLHALARLLREAGRLDEAIEPYERAVAAVPGNDEAVIALVGALRARGQGARALRVAQARLGLDPSRIDDAHTRVTLIDELVELGRFDAAFEASDALLAAVPGHVDAWAQRARLEERQGRPEKAVQALRRAAALSWVERLAEGTQQPISRLALASGAEGDHAPAVDAVPRLQVNFAERAAAKAESEAWRAQRPLADLLEQQSTWWAVALDRRWRDGSDGTSRSDMRELPVEQSRPWRLGGRPGRLVLRADAAQLDAGPVPLADARAAASFGSLLLCRPACAGTASQRDTGLALNVAFESERLHIDIGTTPLGFAVQRPAGGLRVKGDLGPGSYSLDLSSRPVTSTLLSYAGTRDPRTGATWGGVMASGARLGLSRDDGQAFGAWASFGLHRLHGKNVLSNQRRRALGGAYWRAVNEPDRVLSVGLNTMWQSFTHNAGEFTFGHGGYYSPQSYRSLSLPVNLAQRIGRWSFVLRGSVSRSASRTDAAPYFPTDAAMQAAAEAQAAGTGISPVYTGGSGRGSGHALAAGFEVQWRPQWFIGARIEVERSQDYAPNRALVYLRFAPGGQALRTLAFPPEPVWPTSEY